jgi:hypothetical protein
VIEGPLVQGGDIASKKYNLATPVITRGYENNPDIFAKRRNSNTGGESWYLVGKL